MDLPAVTPLAAGAVDCQVVPLEVKTLPDVLGATNKGEDVPLPKMTLFAVRVDAPVPPLATGKVPVTPVDKGSPVKLVAVPLDGVPKAPPFTTAAPDDPTFMAKAVATPVPRPDTPVEIGKPVALVNVPLVGVPKIGVTNVGLVSNTILPVPVTALLSVTPP